MKVTISSNTEARYTNENKVYYEVYVTIKIDDIETETVFRFDNIRDAFIAEDAARTIAVRIAATIETLQRKKLEAKLDDIVKQLNC